MYQYSGGERGVGETGGRRGLPEPMGTVGRKGRNVCPGFHLIPLPKQHLDFQWDTNPQRERVDSSWAFFWWAFDGEWI